MNQIVFFEWDLEDCVADAFDLLCTLSPDADGVDEELAYRAVELVANRVNVDNIDNISRPDLLKYLENLIE